MRFVLIFKIDAQKMSLWDLYKTSLERFFKNVKL